MLQCSTSVEQAFTVFPHRFAVWEKAGERLQLTSEFELPGISKKNKTTLQTSPEVCTKIKTKNTPK